MEEVVSVVDEPERLSELRSYGPGRRGSKSPWQTWRRCGATDYPARRLALKEDAGDRLL